MSRVRLDIDSGALRLLVGDKTSWSEIAEKYGVTRQAVNSWLAEGKIPPRALVEIALDLQLTAEQVDEILVSPEERLQ